MDMSFRYFGYTSRSTVDSGCMLVYEIYIALVMNESLIPILISITVISALGFGHTSTYQ